jgi:copper chaperone CopZ
MQPMKIEKIILKVLKKDCGSTACSTCADLKADNLKHAIARLDGVLKVKIDEISGKVTLEYDAEKIIFSKIIQRIEKLGYQVQVKSKEEKQ